MCTVPASAGMFDVPVELAAAMPVGTYVQLYLTNSTTGLAAADGWTIETSASSVSPTRSFTIQ